MLVLSHYNVYSLFRTSGCGISSRRLWDITISPTDSRIVRHLLDLCAQHSEAIVILFRIGIHGSAFHWHSSTLSLTVFYHIASLGQNIDLWLYMHLCLLWLSIWEETVYLIISSVFRRVCYNSRASGLAYENSANPLPVYNMRDRSRKFSLIYCPPPYRRLTFYRESQIIWCRWGHLVCHMAKGLDVHSLVVGALQVVTAAICTVSYLHSQPGSADTHTLSLFCRVGFGDIFVSPFRTKWWPSLSLLTLAWALIIVVVWVSEELAQLQRMKDIYKYTQVRRFSSWIGQQLNTTIQT